MALLLLAVTPRSPTRLRLFFDHTLAVGAFVPSLYTVTSDDSVGADAPVVAALAVLGSIDVVELVLSTELVGGALYEVHCAAVPDTEPATFTGSLPFRPGRPAPAPSASFTSTELEELLYGVDYMWDGKDLVEDATGDLATVGGVANANAAIGRILESNGLPWDAAHGAKLRRFVDAPSPTLPAARTSAHSGLLRDDRVRSVTSSIVEGDNTGTPIIDMQVNLIGNRTLSFQRNPSAAV